MPASGLWSESQSWGHINRLQLEAVFLALKDFRPQLEQRHALIPTNNMSVVSYINHQGGVFSNALYKQAVNLLLQVDHHFLSIRAAHIPSFLNHRADMLSWKGICKIREEGASVMLIAPNWPNQPWFLDLTDMLVVPFWPIPIRKDLLSLFKSFFTATI